MRWDLNDTDNSGRKYPTFEKGKRYNLVVVSAKDKKSKEKQTPYLHIEFETERLEPAFDKKLWNTPAAAWRAKEWMKAFGFKGEGDEDISPDKLVGCRLSAECDKVKGTDDKDYVEWILPLQIKIGDAPAGAPPAQAKQTAPAAAPVDSDGSGIEEVPF